MFVFDHQIDVLAKLYFHDNLLQTSETLLLPAVHFQLLQCTNFMNDLSSWHAEHSTISLKFSTCQKETNTPRMSKKNNGLSFFYRFLRIKKYFLN